MDDFSPTASQRLAITELEKPLFLAAGAGSGKTGVVTRRFVHAISTGYARVDEILTITFTKKAAAEMMGRIRELLRERWVLDGRPDEKQLERMAAAYRDIERAHISTIDSFCASLLRANALAAGIDPNFIAADETQPDSIREEAFETALRRLVEERGAAAVELIAAYDPGVDGELLKNITRAYEALRSQGSEPRLPLPELPPDPAPAAEGLRRTITAAREAVRSLDKATGTMLKGLESLEILEEALDAGGSESLRLAEKGMPKGNFTSVKPEFAAVKAAVAGYCNVIRSQAAMETLVLFDRLLVLFGGEYQSLKHQRGMLDFGDLSVMTRDLLKNNRHIRNRIAARFRLIMVDEFQDTNPLQHEIISMISREDSLFVVGDENQSIYGFRDAEVGLFRQEKAKAAAAGIMVSLAENFRSQPEILDFVDHIFGRDDMLGDGYLKLEPFAAHDGREEECRVELLLVDEGRADKETGAGKLKVEPAVRVEAQLIAERLREIFNEPDETRRYGPGDTALLVRYAKRAEVYRDALMNSGIDSYLSVGSKYFGKLELGDVLNMLRVIVNPLDDVALMAVLRSPMVRLDEDELFLLRQAAGPGGRRGRPLWRFISRLSGDENAETALDADTRGKLAVFGDGLLELRRVAGREPLGVLVRRVIDFSDLAAKAAAGPTGKQRLANLNKLLDLAADFQEVWGDDLSGFVRFLERQRERRSRQAEAPVEEEGVEAVRILTMHAAKGLEFPLVVLPNLGAYKSNDDQAVLLDRQRRGRIGLDYKDDDGFGGKAFQYEVLKEEEHERGRREEKRLGYVAMTRARSHLILSGIAPADKLPGKRKKNSPALDWLRDILGLVRERDGALGGTEYLDVNGVRVSFHVCAETEPALERFRKASHARRQRQLEPVNPEVERIPPSAVFVPPKISASALDTLAACRRRYYFEQVLRAGHLMNTQGAGPRATSPAGRERLEAWQTGTLVHAILEEAPKLDRIDVDAVTGEELDRLASRVLEPGWRISVDDRKNIARLLENFAASPAASRLLEAAAAGNLQRELPFSTLLGETILTGTIDALAVSDGSVLVVDYKTGGPLPGTLEEAAGHYRMQIGAYALAAGRMFPGSMVEVTLVFLDRPGAEADAGYRSEDLSQLESELIELVASMEGSTFPPLTSFDKYYCTWCPGGPNGARLCATGGHGGAGSR